MTNETPPQLEEITEGKENKPCIGDLVQWSSQGSTQWVHPKQIIGFSKDGKYAFVEDSTTGIPVSQLSLEAVGERKTTNTYLDKTPDELREMQHDVNREKIINDTRKNVLNRWTQRRVVTTDTPDGTAVGISRQDEEEQKIKQNKQETNSRIREINRHLKLKGFAVQNSEIDIFANGGNQIIFVGSGNSDIPLETQGTLSELGVTIEKNEGGETVLVCTLGDADRAEISKHLLKIVDALPYPQNKDEDVTTDTDNDIEVEKSNHVESPEKTDSEVILETHSDNLNSRVNKTELPIDDFFSTFADNPDLFLGGIEDTVRLRNTDGSLYTSKQGVAVVVSTLKEIYPVPAKMAERLRNIFSRFEELKILGESRSPGKEGEAYENYAINALVAEMPSGEKGLFMQKVGALVQKPETETGDFDVSNTIDPAFVMSDFIKVVNQLKG